MNTASAFVARNLAKGKTPNRLIHEKSPYLLQHAFNPVDWYPWGEEAFAKARTDDKPIFLSIGYSTCYWCHVMEREVFENADIAKLMNENFVCIKVDREERPDVDHVYMTALQAISGSGGWPMSMFLTPELKPFFGTTYIPPTERGGRPGFPQITKRIRELWRNARRELLESGDQIVELINNHENSVKPVEVNDSVFSTGYTQLYQTFDSIYAGFGSGPKFPRPVSFNFLLRYYARTRQDSALTMTLSTLRKMYEGGVHDHIGGGFHRYSVDGQWRVPHFEKMLYDQAQLTSSYLEAYQITHDSLYADAARDILEYVLRNLSYRDGGFFSAEDAESAADIATPDEKEEGTFYVWTKGEIDSILGKENADIVNFYYGVQDTGNALNDPMSVFLGKNILYIAHSVEETGTAFSKPPDEIRQVLAASRRKLFAEREKRPRPHLDDKIITGWNGLMISAFSKAYQVLDEPRYLEAAERSARFIINNLYDNASGKLMRRYRDGEARFDGTLQDYSFLTMGLLDLYEGSFDIHWLDVALSLARKQIEIFWDQPNGGFFDTPEKVNEPAILLRTKDDYDGAEPTGNSIAALNLLRLGQMTDNKEWHQMAEATINAFGSRIQQTPEVTPQMLVALDWNLSTPKEIIIVGTPGSEDSKSMLRAVHSNFIPNKVILYINSENAKKRVLSFLPFIEGMKMIDNKTTVYICENYACQLPTNDPKTAARMLTTTVKPKN